MRELILHQRKIADERHLDVLLRLGDASGEATDELRLRFVGVTGLRLAWPDQSNVLLGPIDVSDVRADGWEDVSYRVVEGEGVFSFWCQDFESEVVAAADCETSCAADCEP